MSFIKNYPLDPRIEILLTTTNRATFEALREDIITQEILKVQATDPCAARRMRQGQWVLEQKLRKFKDPKMRMLEAHKLLQEHLIDSQKKLAEKVEEIING